MFERGIQAVKTSVAGQLNYGEADGGDIRIEEGENRRGVEFRKDDLDEDSSSGLKP